MTKFERAFGDVLGNLFYRFSRSIPRMPKPAWRWTRLSILIFVDTSAVVAAFWLSFLLRFEFAVPRFYTSVFLNSFPAIVGTTIPVLWWGGVYRQVWRYATLHSGLLVFRGTLLGAVIGMSVCYVFRFGVPRSIFVMHLVLTTAFICLSRIAWRVCINLATRSSSRAQERCLIYGAGSAGDLLARHISANPKFPYRIVGFIDDDPNKVGRNIHGLSILGGGKSLSRICSEERISVVVLAMPSAAGKIIRDAVANCQSAGVKALIMPDMASALGDEVFRPRPIDIRDLMRRAPKALDQKRVTSFFRGRTVLVTGAGGSIGSEICRQVMDAKPDRLLMLDASEFSLYQIDMELRDRGVGEVDVVPLLGSMTDSGFVNGAFRRYGPSVVLHAAAYKHVPLVEANAVAGVINNVFGTKIVASAAVEHGVERFLLISSDKAVRPTSVMGATKRVCELLIQSIQELHPNGTKFSAVRFGNVLGSSGSVVPRFLQQIQNGGPVTVTHPDMTRYFMLTSEAVGLVLQANTMALGGEIFVLDMGEPVNIMEMAKQLVRLAGKEPGRDIEVQVTGIRPGEKLWEELLLEGVEQRTLHDDIFVTRPLKLDIYDIEAAIDGLLQTAAAGNETDCRKRLMDLATGLPEPLKAPHSADEVAFH